MPDFFLQILMFAQQSDVLDFKSISIDGSKILASASKKNSYKEDTLNKKLDEVREEIAQYLAQCELAESGDEDSAIDLQTVRAEKERLEQLEAKLSERLESRSFGTRA